MFGASTIGKASKSGVNVLESGDSGSEKSYEGKHESEDDYIEYMHEDTAGDYTDSSNKGDFDRHQYVSVSVSGRDSPPQASLGSASLTHKPQNRGNSSM